MMLLLDNPGLLLLLIMVGALELFFGYYLVRILAVVAGVFIGLNYGPYLYALYTNSSGGSDIAVLFSFLLGIGMGLLAWFAFHATVFCWGIYGGYALGIMVFDGAIVSALLLALSLAIVVVLYERLIIVTATALSGAWFVVAGVAFFLGYLSEPTDLFFRQYTPEFYRPFLILLVLVLTVGGMLLQFRRISRGSEEGEGAYGLETP